MTKTEQYTLVIVLLILLIQSIWIFIDANKKGHNKWLWGFLGLLNCPSALIIYLIVTRVIDKKITCPNCLYAIPANSKYCNYCGHMITDSERVKGTVDYKENEKLNR